MTNLFINILNIEKNLLICSGLSIYCINLFEIEDTAVSENIFRTVKTRLMTFKTICVNTNKVSLLTLSMFHHSPRVNQPKISVYKDTEPS